MSIGHDRDDSFDLDQALGLLDEVAGPDTRMAPGKVSLTQSRGGGRARVPGKRAPSYEVYGTVFRSALDAAPPRWPETRQEPQVEGGSDETDLDGDAGALVEDARHTAGAALPADFQARAEALTGANLSGVRVHTGPASADAAAALDARAFTVGQDIHMPAGEYDPGSTAGQHLLAHEVVHAAQQQGSTSAGVQTKLRVSAPEDACEREAERLADRFVERPAAAPAGMAGTGRPAAAEPRVSRAPASIQRERAGGERSAGEQRGAGAGKPAAYQVDEAMRLVGRGSQQAALVLTTHIPACKRAIDALSPGEAGRGFDGLQRAVKEAASCAQQARLLAVADPYLPPDKKRSQDAALFHLARLESTLRTLARDRAAEVGPCYFRGQRIGSPPATGDDAVAAFAAQRPVVPLVRALREAIDSMRGAPARGSEGARWHAATRLDQAATTPVARHFVDAVLRAEGLYDELGSVKPAGSRQQLAARMGRREGWDPRSAQDLLALLAHIKDTAGPTGDRDAAARMIGPALAYIDRTVTQERIDRFLRGRAAFIQGNSIVRRAAYEMRALHRQIALERKPWDALADLRVKHITVAREFLEILGEEKHYADSDVTDAIEDFHDAPANLTLVLGGLALAGAGAGPYAAALGRASAALARSAIPAAVAELNYAAEALAAARVWLLANPELGAEAAAAATGVVLQYIDDPDGFLAQLESGEGWLMMLLEALPMVQVAMDGGRGGATPSPTSRPKESSGAPAPGPAHGSAAARKPRLDVDPAEAENLREAATRALTESEKLGEVIRKRHPSDPPKEYQYNDLNPGPLTNHRELKKSLANGFFGGKYDEEILETDRVFYRVAREQEAMDGVSQLGRWFSEAPPKSDMELQMDMAVKPIWRDPITGKVDGISPPEVMMTVRVPKGTKVYIGPVAPQGDGQLGGNDKIQVCIPDIRATKGVEILVTVPFQRHGHTQPRPASSEETR